MPERLLSLYNPDRASIGLAGCLDQLYRGPWSFIQLRGEPVGESSIDADDVDLLGSRESVFSLLDVAFDWARAGDCHARIATRSGGKVELTLFSLDGRHRLQFDLWIELNQFDRGRRTLGYHDLAAHVVDSHASIQRLAIDLEACVYVQHLICKRKDLASERVQQRLRQYVAKCEAAGHGTLAALLLSIADRQETTSDAEQGTLSRLGACFETSAASRMCATGSRSALSGVLSKLRIAWLAAPRRTSLVSLMGCDGTGKTTIGETLAARRQATRLFTGKHLYRKSLTYKLAVIFIRPLMRTSREVFDERLSPLVYLRACLGLRIRSLLPRRGLTLVDRSLIDFLYIGRKTDESALCRSSWLARIFGLRIPTVHCLVRYDKLVLRKQEMTERGHAAYDAAMFEHFSRRLPTDYIAFNNDQSLDHAAAALGRVLETGYDLDLE